MTTVDPSPRRGDSAARTFPRYAAALLALSLPALLFPGVMQEAAHAATVLAQGGSVSPRDRLFAFGLAPVVGVSASILFLAPGLLLARRRVDASAVDRWLVHAAAISLAVVSVVAAVGQALAGDGFRGAAFGWTLAALVAALGVVEWRRSASGAVSDAAPADRRRGAALVLAIVVPMAIAVVLAPKLHWEAFNGDGVHAFESARRLLVQPLPFWPDSAGAIAGFPGVSSMLYAYPTAWYIRLFGAVDVAARLPFLLYIPLLVSALVWVIGVKRDRAAVPLDERTLVWAGALVYVVAMAWSATYNPYAADIALPATQDTLLVVVYLGFVAAFVERSFGWAAVFGALTYISLPSGLILIGFWMLAVVAAWRPVPVRDVKWTVGLLVALVVGGALLPRLLGALHLPLPGREYGLVGILRYFAFLRFDDVVRFRWVAVACGIVPLVSTLLWRRQDQVARALSLVIAAYFLFFYVQANVSLHHFVPVMLLPLAVSWRSMPSGGPTRSRWVVATASGIALSLALAWPGDAAPHVEGRRVGLALWNRVGGYDRSNPESFAASELLRHLFPLDWDPSVPGVYGGAPVVWHRYARLADTNTVNYILQRRSDAPPIPGHLVADSAGFTLWVRNDSIWESHKRLRPHTPAGSRWLAVPRPTLFRSVSPDPGAHVIDVVDLLSSIGLPMDDVLRKLNVQR